MNPPDAKQNQTRDDFEQRKQYDLFVTHELDWPTLTCQWLPGEKEENGILTRELMVGTNTKGDEDGKDQENNYIKFISFEIPVDIDESDESKSQALMKTTQTILHEGEVNRARYQPSNPNIIATMTRVGDVLVFDRSNVGTTDVCEPMLRLKGHKEEGYGLAWNPHPAKSNHLLSAGYDNLVCLWDTISGDRVACYEAHTGCVEDVSWNADSTVFASVADDMKLLIWDSRGPSKPVHSVFAHNDIINTVAFHPRKETRLATGSADKTIGVFDIRNLAEKWHTMEHQTEQKEEITQVAWSPHDDPILASAAKDRTIHVWDLRRNGEEQTPEDIEDGPPELMFVHAEHTSEIAEFCWDPLERWRIASAAADNVVHVWEMSKAIYADTTVVASDLE